MGFQRMRGDAGIIAPDFMQQIFARDGRAIGAIEKAQYIAFLFGQANPLAIILGEDFQRRFEFIGADFQHRRVAVFILAQMRPYARQQYTEFERLGDIIISTGIKAKNRIRLRAGAGQHDDWRNNFLLTHDFAGFAAILVGQADIEQNKVEALLPTARQTVRRRIGKDQHKLLMQSELLFQRFAQHSIIFNHKDFMLHGQPRILRVAQHIGAMGGVEPPDCRARQKGSDMDRP